MTKLYHKWGPIASLGHGCDRAIAFGFRSFSNLTMSHFDQDRCHCEEPKPRAKRGGRRRSNLSQARLRLLRSLRSLAMTECDIVVLIVILRSEATKNLVAAVELLASNGILRSLRSLRMTDLTGPISNAIALMAAK